MRLDSKSAAAALALAMFAGCGDEGETARKEIGEALTAVKAYSFEQKDKFCDELKDAADKAKEELRELQEKADDAAADVKQELEPALAALRRKHAELESRLSEAKEATADRWEDVRDRCDTTLRELRSSLTEAWADLKGNR
jgi:gas vesicle protein